MEGERGKMCGGVCACEGKGLDSVINTVTVSGECGCRTREGMVQVE